MSNGSPTETVSLGPDEEPGAPLARWRPGQLVAGRYEIHEVLGTGGFAVVYRALDRVLARDVALKVLREDRCSSASLRRFLREAEVARSLENPHLVRILDFAEVEGTAVLAMELVAGGTLRDRLSSGPLPIDEAIRIAVEVARGLEALHAAGVLHRDLKPGNVLFSASGAAKLGDLGLVLDTSSDATRLTTDGSLLGTLEYLSPEQALGEPLDRRSDLFSLGVVLFEMLTGRLPFEARSSLGTLLVRFHSRVGNPRALRPEVPDWLGRVTLRLLERDAGERYATAEALIRDLERRGSGLRVTRRARRRLGWIGAGAALALLVSLLATGRSRAGFSHVVFDAPGRARAIAADGRTLWSRTGPPISRNFETIRVGAGEGRRIAAILVWLDGRDPGARPRLSLLDPDDGQVVSEIALPDERVFFKDFSSTWSTEVRAFDVDGDGRDEVFVTFLHVPYWPSYTVLVEPALARARTILLAGGHHRPLGAVDVDGDSRAEVLLGGMNNRAGHLHAVAAVRLVPPLGEGTDSPSYQRSAYTPNFSDRLSQGENLLVWYAVLPSLRFDLLSPFGVDASRRLILAGSPPSPILTFDGFPPEAVSELPVAERQALRWSAWSRIREAERSLANGFEERAAESLAEAADRAGRAGDPLLGQWARQSRVSALVRGGRTTEAEAALVALFGSSEGPSEVAFRGARELHRAGHLEAALTWYRRALGPDSGQETTRSSEELLEGLLAVLAELGRFEEAEAEVTRLGRAWEVLEERLETYRRYLRWLQGEPVEPTPQTDEPSSSDLLRYWGLEFRRSSGEPANELLRRVETERTRISADLRPFLSGLEARLLFELGRLPEALDRIRPALSEAPERVAEEPNLRLVAAMLERRAREIEAGGPSAVAREDGESR